MNKVFLCLGSNIDPEKNLQKAMELLGREAVILSSSQIWETEAVGSEGPNFLNQIVLISSTLPADDIKKNIIGTIENKLGRIRTNDKNAPRTIDLDIIIFNQDVLDDSIWTEAYVALPLAELLPDLTKKGESKSLKDIASELAKNSFNKIFNS